MRSFLLFTIGCIVLMPAGATEPVHAERYALFGQAWRSREAADLDLLAPHLAKDPDPWTRELAVITTAAAAVRHGNDVLCLRLMDSLEHVIPGEHHLIASWMHRLRAMSYKRTRALDRAEEEVLKGLELIQNKGYRLEEASALIALAEVCRATHDLARAMELLQKAEILLDGTGDEVVLCDLYINRGNLYYEQDRFPEAWAMYKRTMDMATRNDLRSMVRNAGANLAAVAYMTDRNDLALALYDSLDLALAGMDTHLHAEIIRHSGLTLAAMDRHEQAIGRFERALAMQQVVGDIPGRAKTLQMLSTSLWALGRRQEAVRMSEEALAKARNDIRLVSELHFKLHTWYAELGHTQRSLDALRAHKVLDDSLKNALFSERMAQMEVRYDTEKKERSLAQRETELWQETDLRRQRTTQRNVLLACTALLIVFSTMLFRNMQHRRRLAEQDRLLYQERINDQMQRSEVRVLNAMMEGQDKERERIAKDLHDRLGSLLSAIKLQFGALEERIQVLRTEQREQYDKVYGLLDHAVSEVRRISHNMMRGTLAQFGLHTALHDLRSSVAVKGQLEVELNLFGLEERMDRRIEVTAYRIVQELVTNALKHARPTEISVALTRTDTTLHIVVNDNGAGFDTAALDRTRTGMGLANVRERAAAHHGVVILDSTPGRGTTITVEMALSDEQA